MSIVPSNRPQRKVSHIVDCAFIDTPDDILKLEIIDWNRLSSWENTADALQTISSWFLHKAFYTIVEHDMTEAPDFLCPPWNHTGTHHIDLGRYFWNDFHWRQRGTLTLADEPDFSGVLFRPRGKQVRFWGDIGKVSAHAFALTQKQMGAHDLWISVVSTHRQVIIEPIVSLKRQWAVMFQKYAYSGEDKPIRGRGKVSEQAQEALWKLECFR